jgi:hypothetical protein
MVHRFLAADQTLGFTDVAAESPLKKKRRKVKLTL